MSPTPTLTNGPQSRALHKWGEGAKNLTASRHQGCPNKVPVNSQSNEETGKRGDMVKVKQEDNKERLGIGIWNVRSLNMTGKVEEVKWVMERYRLGIQQIRVGGDTLAR